LATTTRLRRKKVKNIVSLRKYTNSDKPLSEHLKFFRPNFDKDCRSTEQHTAFRRKRGRIRPMDKKLKNANEKKDKSIRVTMAHATNRT